MPGRRRSSGNAARDAHQQAGSPARMPQRNDAPQRAQTSAPGAGRPFVSGDSFIILSSIRSNDDRTSARPPENVAPARQFVLPQCVGPVQFGVFKRSSPHLPPCPSNPTSRKSRLP
jgi:hypothetical protein